jgi:hypothetical protein
MNTMAAFEKTDRTSPVQITEGAFRPVPRKVRQRPYKFNFIYNIYSIDFICTYKYIHI